MGKVFVRYICAYCILVTAKETINYMINAVWSRSAVLYEMNLRQATPEGTLAAAAERLGFLRDLGIDAVWLMPHYPIGEVGRKGSLGSYYSIRDYRAVDPELGTLADFDAFVRRAHALGMKVLIDWVANHTSRDARWLAECPADWYERDASGRPVVPNGWDDTAKLDYTNRAVWQGQIDAMRFWLAEHGVDGFRCDMAMLVPIEFWQEAARRLRAVKPDLFLLAEAEELSALCHFRHVPFVIDDNVEVALAAGADGVHVGQSDMAAKRARALLGPDKILGVSAHNAAEALAAQADGADYLGCGAAFVTGTKLDAHPVTAETMRAVTAAVNIPVVAIGGIDAANLLQLQGRGLAGVAVVSAIFAQADPCTASRELYRLAGQL